MKDEEQELTEEQLIEKRLKGEELTREQKALMARLVKARMPRSRVDLYSKRIAKLSKQGYLIDTIWPEGTVHLIAGPSGIGKSTWLLKAIYDWEHGEPVMGFPSHPVPYVYLMCDRSEVDLQRTLNRMGLGEWHVNAYSIESLGQLPFLLEPQNTDIEHLPSIFPWAKVFFIEAINWFYKGKSSNASRDYVDTLRFWSHVRDKFCEEDLTVIGTTHIPKMKLNEGYSRARDKVFGSVGGPAVAGTIIVMEDNTKDPDQIILTVCARDAREFKVDYRRGLNGILEFIGTRGFEIPDDETKDSGAFMLFDRRLATLTDGTILRAETIIEWHRAINVSRKTANRWIAAKIDSNELTKVQRGEWRVKNRKVEKIR